MCCLTPFCIWKSVIKLCKNTAFMAKNKNEFLSLVSLLCGLFLLVFFLFMQFSSAKFSFPDFKTYVQSYGDFHSGKNIYQRFLSTFPEKDPRGKYFAYLPPFIGIGYLLNLVALPVNFCLFQWLSLLCFYISCFLLFRYFTLSKNVFFQFAFSSFLLFAFPSNYTFAMGQINFFLLFFITLFLVALKRHKPFLASAFLLPVSMAKFFPSLLFLSLLKVRRSAFFFSMGLVGGFIALSFFFLPHETAVFFQQVAPRRFHLIDYVANQSLSLFLTKADIPSFWVLPFLLTVLAVAFLRLRSALHFSFFLLPFSFLFTPLSWIHHYVLVYPCYFYLLNKKRSIRLCACFSFFLVSFLPLKLSYNPFFSFSPLYGLILLVMLIFFSSE